MFEEPDGTMGRVDVFCGVPQGLVLGPLLWNITYDVVLTGTVLLESVSITCYADDTLRRDWAEAQERAELGSGVTVETIHGIGLGVCLPKTEVCDFHHSRNPLPRNLALRLEESEIRVGRVLKYLGVTLDPGLSFAQYLPALDSKLRATSASLGRLMPNLRGPGVVTRKLYRSTS